MSPSSMVRRRSGLYIPRTVVSNDLFANAMAVSIPTNGATYTSPGVPSASFTTETNEPAGVTNSNVRSAWWKYTPAGSGLTTFFTGPSFRTATPAAGVADTQIAIYLAGGSAFGLSAMQAGSQDDGTSHGGAQYTSWCQLSVTAGVTYYIQVGTWSTEPALTYVLQVTGPAT